MSAPHLTSSGSSERVASEAAVGSEPASPTFAEQLAELRREIELRDQFIGTAAHELRNPISPLYIQLEHLKEMIEISPDPIDKSWLMHQLQAMTGRLDRFIETLNRLLDASRLGAGHLVLLPEPCDLVEVTHTVLASAQREIHASACVVELEAPEVALGWWDRLRLEQIIGNLISNAARYGAGRPISIAITADTDDVRLRVRDRGIGIAEDDLPRIFQRFERACNVGRSAGFGIGLWIVAELCRAMGGKVEVESELAKGSVFTITLPRQT